MRRTTNGAKYIAPTSQMMRESAEKYGIKTFSTDFVEDILNIQTGGKMVTLDEYLRNCKFRPIKPGEDQEHYNCECRKYKQRASNTYNGVKKVLENVDFSRFQGNSPLDRAMDFISKLSLSKGGDSDEASDPDSPIIPIFEESDSVDNIIDNSENIESLEGEDGEVIGQFSLDNKTILEFSKVKSKVDSLAKFKAAKISKAVPDRNGKAMRLRVMNSPSELVNVTPDAFALPKSLLAYKIATRQLLVREKVNYEERKQFLYCIIDRSGSMRKKDRCGQALAVLVNRVQAVINGDATLIVSWFDRHLRDMFLIQTIEDARGFINALKKCSSNTFSGSTDINYSLEEAVTNIESLLKDDRFVNSDRPELCIITDGDDEVNLDISKLKGVKLHAFLVGGTHNRELQDLALKSGGVSVNVGSEEEEILPF